MCIRDSVWIDYDYLNYYTNSELHAHAAYVIGNIESHAGFQLAGQSMNEILEYAAHSTQKWSGQLSSLRSNIATDLDSNLNRSRQNIRERLRGPGAGGGYNKGPGAGGGYDKGTDTGEGS